LIKKASEKIILKNILEEFFQFKNGTYYNSRCDEELANVYSKSVKAKEKAEKRWAKNSHENDAVALPQQCYSNADAMLPVTRNPLPVTHDPSPVTHGSALADNIKFPDWLNKEKWDQYVENRKFMKSVMSKQAVKVGLTELTKLKEQGYNPDDLIDKAILSNWKSFYATGSAKKTATPIADVWEGKKGGIVKSYTDPITGEMMHTTITPEQWKAEWLAKKERKNETTR
jgi:hypothetical protein